MKNIIILSMIVLAFLACKKEENAPTPQQPTEQVVPDTMPPHPIHGKWSLLRYSRGWFPTQHYAPNTVTWQFLNTNTIVVQTADGITIHEGVPLNTPGQYSYSITSDNTMMVQNSHHGYLFQGDTLRIFQN